MDSYLYHSFLKNSPTGIYISKKGQCKYVNDTLIQWLGYKQNEFIKIDYFKLIHQEYKKNMKTLFMEIQKGFIKKLPVNKEFKAIKKDGTTIWLLATIDVLEYEGSPAIVNNIANITQWKRAEEELKKSEENYRSLFERIPVGIYRTTPSGQIIDCNPALLRMLGYSSKKGILNSKATKHFVDGKNRKIEQKILQERGVLHNFEAELYRRDGTVIWTQDNARAVSDQNGKVLFYEGIIKDITDQKKAEEKLRKSEQRFRNFADLLPQPVMEVDLSGKFTYTNRAGFELSGYNSEDLKRGLNIADMVIPEDQNRIKKNFMNRLKGKIPGKNEFTGRTKSGQILPILIYSSPIFRGEKPIGMRGIILDISQLKLAEERLKEMSIRDPLTNIFNRRYIFDRLKEMTEKHKRDKSVFSIAILDIDHFKRINDSYGHLAGDMILKDFTEILQSNLRPYDLLGRFGGEEFIIVFVDINTQQSSIITERILKDTRDKMFVYKQNNINFTFSCGISDITKIKHSKSMVDNIIGKADDRLYKAKDAGRNRIIIK